MSMRSRKKEIYWGVARRRIPSQLLKRLKVFNATKFWNAIGFNVTSVFGGDLSIAWDWLNTPATALDGVRPLDLLTNGNVAALRDYLIRLEHCVYI